MQGHVPHPRDAISRDELCLLFQIRKLRLKAIQIIQAIQGTISSKDESWNSTSGIQIPQLQLLPVTSQRYQGVFEDCVVSVFVSPEAYYHAWHLVGIH